jgi:dolichol-phosphate mannosyltransferase
MISLVIPTYNEAAVIQETLRRAAGVLADCGEPFELIVVDDSSPDGTADLAEQLAGDWPVQVLRRTGERGLATAIVAGWKAARGDVLGVMDADLQHPPEVVSRLLAALRAQNADIAVASRYRPGGGTEGWSWFRRLVSYAGMRVGTSSLPWTLGEVTDSGSGLFLVRAQALEGVELKPMGFKMLLEVLSRAHYQKLVEVPYVFRGRALGESKLGPRQYVEYLLHLLQTARDSGELKAWVLYALSGLAGAAVYVAALTRLAKGAEWPLALALPVSILLGLLTSFAADDLVTFRRRGASAMKLPRLPRRLVLCGRAWLSGGLVNAGATLIARSAGLELWAAAGIGVAATLPWNFFCAVPAIWDVWRLTPPRTVAVAGKF